jgi:pyruvate dehydrogenase E1 component beta subunit
MAIELKMPALSPTMEEGKLARWLVKEGDEVKSGDILAEIETDKATMEFEAVDEGTIGKIVIPEGTEGVKVGTVIATIGDGDVETSAPVAAAARWLRLPLLRLPWPPPRRPPSLRSPPAPT